MPRSDNDEALANDFANFFMDEIWKIHDALQQHDKYTPTRNTNVNILASFREMTEDEVIKITGEMSPKSCELDAIPSLLPKQLVTDLAPTLTKLVKYFFNIGGVCNRLEDVDHQSIIKETRACNYYWQITGQWVIFCLSQNWWKSVHWSNLSYIAMTKILYQNTKVHTEVDIVEKQNWSRSQIISCFLQKATCISPFSNGLIHHFWYFQPPDSTRHSRKQIWNNRDHTKLVQDYLQPRFCKVYINKSYSKPWDLAFSIPEGSCAGPIIYLAYASTMEDVIPLHICLYGYADLTEWMRPIQLTV